MKELTAAQGKLRCGECGSVFNAMDSLSTKLPEQADPSEKVSFESLNKKQLESYRVAKSPSTKSPAKSIKKPNKTLWATVATATLVGLLATQVWATRDTWLSPSKAPDKIKMTSRKVFSHPSEPNALIITGLIENTAEHAQEYPFLEAKLLDNNNKLVALRRFRPEEYLENYTTDTLIKSSETTSIRLKIQDPPGNKAKHFQFSFL
jgi:hypothetical protein